MSADRIHGLDFLRGLSMILGIVLHGAIAYKAGYPYGELIHDVDAEYYFYDWLHQFINLFRMQIFFLLAGFFCSLVIVKKGLGLFAKDRFRRIAIPLALSYLTILPATLIPFVLFQYEGADPWKHVSSFLIDFYTFRQFSGLIHLWFLYDLIIFYVGIMAATWLVDMLGIKLSGIQSLLQRINAPVFILICLATTFLTSRLYDLPVLTIWTGLRPPMAQLLYYGSFFVIGWYLEKNRYLITQLQGKHWVMIGAGVVLGFVNFYMLNFQLIHSTAPSWMNVAYGVLSSMQTVLITFGLLVLFYVSFPGASDTGRYLANSAYWVYLIHNPVVLMMQLVLLDSFVPPMLRFPLVIMVAAAISYASYHYLARTTWVGRLLNGK